MPPLDICSTCWINQHGYIELVTKLCSYFTGWVVGSLELLGNPTGLVRSIGTGVADLVSLPYDALTRGPGAFLAGVTRGVSSLVRNTTQGGLWGFVIGGFVVLWCVLSYLWICGGFCCFCDES